MTHPDAWEEATTDARRTLQAHLDTIDELNRQASNTLRLNAVVVSLVAAGLYQTSPPRLVLVLVAIGVAAIGMGSYFAFRVLHTEPVSAGIPPTIDEDLRNQDVSADQYYRHICGVIYPSAIRDARRQSDEYSDALNRVYTFTGAGIVVLALGGALMGLDGTILPGSLHNGSALVVS